MTSINETLALLNKSYSPFHVVKNIEEKLLSSGYQMLKEQEMYQLKAGGRYFVKRNGTSIIAFSIPNDLSRPYFKISATHNDSPTFKLKPNPVVIYKNLASLNVEPYGGAIYSTWMDRPLSLAGRVMVEGENGVEAKLLAIDEDLLEIPNLCIHMNREINKGYCYNPAKDMLPLLGEVKEGFDFNAYLGEKLGLKGEEKVLSFDLFLYNREEAKLMGMNKEFLAGAGFKLYDAATEGNQTFTSGTSTDEDHYQAITVAKRNLTITIFDAEKEYELLRDDMISALNDGRTLIPGFDYLPEHVTFFKNYVVANRGSIYSEHGFCRYMGLSGVPNAHKSH